MFMKKKAQAAMEFLMTYGWAILVVLVVIGALSYFGVLNPQNLLPEKCTLPMGLYCKDHIIKQGGDLNGSVSLKLENGMGRGIMIRNIIVEGANGQVVHNCSIDLTTDCNSSNVDDEDDCGYNSIEGWHIANGDMGSVTIDDCTVDEFTGKTKADITLVYCSDTSMDEDDCGNYSHTMEGDLMAKVE